jgi:hypothetical protein
VQSFKSKFLRISVKCVGFVSRRELAPESGLTSRDSNTGACCLRTQKFWTCGLMAMQEDRANFGGHKGDGDRYLPCVDNGVCDPLAAQSPPPSAEGTRLCGKGFERDFPPPDAGGGV